MFSSCFNLFFMFFLDKEGDVKALVILSKILFQRCGPHEGIANLIKF